MPMKVLDNQEEKTKEFLCKIGEIVVTLNHLEEMVCFYIWELVSASGNTQGVGRRITVNLELIEKIDLLRSLIIERQGEEKAKVFKSIYKNIIKCGEIRNDIAHSQWFIQYGNIKENIPPRTEKINMQKLIKNSKPTDFSKLVEIVDLEQLNQGAVLINKTAEDLAQFMFDRD